MKKLNLKPNTYPGTLITFCGLDGCGKTTMIQRLADELSDDFDIVLTKQPTNSVRNSDIFRTYMDEQDHSAYDYRSLSLLAASDRIQHVNKVIVPALESGKTVISDRYFYSCLANLHARGFKKDKWIYEIAESIVKPDAAVFIDVPVHTAVRRVRSRPEEKLRYIDMELQYALRSEYNGICRANGGISVRGDISPDNTYNEILNNILKILEDKKWIHRKQ